MSYNNKNGLVAYQSSINNEFVVLVIFSNFPYYTEMRSQLNELDDSIGALIVGTKTILIDGEQCMQLNLDKNAILCIEAHEIAHYILNHTAGFDLETEKEADVLALGLLNACGHLEAEKMLEERMQRRYKTSHV